MKTALHLSDQRDKDGEIDWRLRHGSYAYWVGDEVKAKINVVEPFISDGVSNVDLLNETNKLKVAMNQILKVEVLGLILTKTQTEKKDLITAQSYRLTWRR